MMVVIVNGERLEIPKQSQMVPEDVAAVLVPHPAYPEYHAIRIPVGDDRLLLLHKAEIVELQ